LQPGPPAAPGDDTTTASATTVLMILMDGGGGNGGGGGGGTQQLSSTIMLTQPVCWGMFVYVFAWGKGGRVSVSDEFVCVMLCPVFAGRNLEDEG